MNNGLIGPGGKPVNIPLKGVRISGKFIGLYGEVSLEQLYVNEGNKALEVIYTFPMPDNAVVSQFSAQVGDRTIEGEIKEKEEAFRVYDEALTKGDSAYLLEEFRPNIFQVSLGRILPGEEIKIRIVYLETLHYLDGEIRISIPTLVAPRYISGGRKNNKTGMGWADPTDRVPDADFITPPVDRGADYRVELDLTFQPLIPVDEFTSPSHNISVEKSQNESIRITLAEGGALLDRDIIILGRCRDDSSSAGASWQDPESGEGYLYVNILPDFGYRENHEARNYIFLIDISGSMHGTKLEQAKNAMQLCLRNMESKDTFNIVAFESDCHYYSKKGSVPFNQATLDSAGQWIDNLSPMGGTEIMAPVDYALKSCKTENDTVILLFTDGQVGNESEIIKQVKSRILGNRLFTFGIDTAVNSYFINKLAEAGGGIPEYIHPGERIEDKVIRQFSRINSPMISKVTVDWSGLESVDAYPKDIPVIFDREPVTLVAKYNGKLKGTVCVSGWFKDEEFRVEMDLKKVGSHKESGFLRKLWGKMKIEHLENMLEEINPRRKQTLIEDLVRVSIDYGVGSSQTSFVAVQERVNKDTGIPETVVVPVAPAAEWEMLSYAPASHEANCNFMLDDSSFSFFEESRSPKGSKLSSKLMRPFGIPSGRSRKDKSMSTKMHAMLSEENETDENFSGDDLLQEAVRSIAMQQMADGAFPSEKGAESAELSTYENTALATLSILLAADNPGMYHRQIEKSVNYLLKMHSEKLFNELQFCLAGLVYKIYPEKIKANKKTAERVRAELERIRQKVSGTLSEVLLKPGLPTADEIKGLLNKLGALGAEKSKLQDLTPKTNIDILASAVIATL